MQKLSNFWCHFVTNQIPPCCRRMEFGEMFGINVCRRFIFSLTTSSFPLTSSLLLSIFCSPQARFFTLSARKSKGAGGGPGTRNESLHESRCFPNTARSHTNSTFWFVKKCGQALLIWPKPMAIIKHKNDMATEDPGMGFLQDAFRKLPWKQIIWSISNTDRN